MNKYITNKKIKLRDIVTISNLKFEYDHESSIPWVGFHWGL